MSFNLFTYTRKISHPLILDGAMGSLLQQKGITSAGKLWTSLANLKKYDIVYNIHRSYIKDGADIITTNTFRTNPAAVNSQQNIKFEKFVKASVQIAKDAAQGQNVLIAGSNAPAEDCYQVERTISKKELEHNHKQHIDELMKNGCDFVLNETQSHFDEIKIICDYCYKNNIPYILSLLVTNKMELLSGENVSEVIQFIRSKDPISIGFNCMSPRVFDKISKQINLNFNWGLYLNLGIENYKSKNMVTSVTPDNYASFLSKYLSNKPSFIGGCCGSNPNHINKLKVMLDGNISN